MSSEDPRKEKGKMIAVVSGKGGTGKTVCTLNVARALHEMDKDVMLIDADIEDPNLGINLGVHTPDSTLNEVISQGIEPEEAIHVHESGLFLLPSSLSVDYAGLDFEYFNKAMQKMDGYILADCGPGINDKVISVLEAADSSIVVTNPIRTSISGALRVIELIKDMDTEIEGIVVNNLTSKELDHEEIEGITGCEILEEIPYAKEIDESITHKRPLLDHSPSSRASHAFRRIAHNLVNEEHRPSLLDKVKTFLNSLTSLFR
ncbi:MAG: MinD/ParA family protein [Candidatus Aenigmatarchaeota archaeon]